MARPLESPISFTNVGRVRWWQRGHRVAPIEDVVDEDLEAGTLRVTSQARHVHPHELEADASR